MKSIVYVASVIFLLISMEGCAVDPELTVVEVDIPTMISNTITVGDNSYIPINLRGRPSEMVDIILKVVNQFKVNHPELIINNWTIEKEQNAHGVRARVFGLWINHHPQD